MLAGHWERQVTKTGDYWTGALTRDGSVIGLQRTDGGRSKLVRLKIDESTITQTTEFAVNLDLPDGGPRHGYLVVSPDAEHVLVGNLLIELNSARRTELVPSGCCDIWSPDGSHIAYLVPGDDWDPESPAETRFDLWVAVVAGEAAPRRLATGLMDWVGMSGRYAESISWSMDGKRILALSARDIEWIEKRGPGYTMYGPVNNRLVSVDLKTGEELELANSIDLHRRLRREADTLAEQVAVSAAATPSGDGAAA